MKALIGRKIGMSQIFNKEGDQVPVTLVQVVPNFIVKSADSQTQIIGVQTRKKADKSTMGNLKKAGIDGVLTKFMQFSGQGELEQFAVGDKVTVSAVSKGKGFAGTIKRHGFKRGPASHGSNNIRQPGSIGAQEPQRVIKGKRMSGHMGAVKRTIKNLKVIDFDETNSLLALKGSLPGPNKGWLKITLS